MQIPNLPKIAAYVSAATVIFGAWFGVMTWLGWPPYAAKAEVEALVAQERADVLELQEQIAANSLANLYIQLENALKSGDQASIRRLCWIIQNETGQKPSGCP